MKIRNVYLIILVIGSIAAVISGVIFPISENSSRSMDTGTVIKVADGDTLTIEENGTKEKIRLCGIDSPEKAQPLGMEAKQALEKMTLGKRVSFTAVERDRYGRIVAEVFVLGEPEHFVNGDMLEAGLAYHYAQYSQNCPNRGVIIDAESIAKSKHVGVWADARAIKPWDYRKRRD